MTHTLANIAWFGYCNGKTTSRDAANDLLAHPDADPTIRQLAQQVLDADTGPGQEGADARSAAFEQILRHLGERAWWWTS